MGTLRLNSSFLEKLFLVQMKSLHDTPLHSFLYNRLKMNNIIGLKQSGVQVSEPKYKIDLASIITFKSDFDP